MWFVVLGLLALVAVVILVWLKGGDAAAAAQWWRTMRGDRTMVKYLVFVRGGLTVAAWLALFVTERFLQPGGGGMPSRPRSRGLAPANRIESGGPSCW